MKYPKPLMAGDTIAIVSPAGIINPDYVSGAVATLRGEGWNPVVYPHALGRHGSYSGTSDERLADLERALTDPSVRAILCSRGGYGAVHLLDRLKLLPIDEDPKWLIGFSDISALHALFNSMGVATLHASMTKQLAKGGVNEINQQLFSILRGERPTYQFAPDPRNRQGSAQGRLAGGNLAVLDGLAGTPYDILQPDTVMFIEDIAEPIYKVERILYRLRLAGVLPRLKGLIVGQFTEYESDSNYREMEDMIADMTAPYGYPVAFNTPIGHVDGNIPVIEGADVNLIVTEAGSTLRFN